MPVRVLILIALTPVLSGCTLELLTTAAIQSELQAQSASNAMKQLEYAQRTADEMKLRQGIDVYKAEQGVYPPSLQALVPGYLDAVPVGPDDQPLYDYDSRTGWIALRTPGSENAPARHALLAEDHDNLTMLREALAEHHEIYRTYPLTLDGLVPDFISYVPLQATADEPYRYFRDTGEVFHPAELLPGYSNQGGPAPGTSLVGQQMEAVRGMQELQARPGDAGSRAVQRTQELATGQNERYEELMRELDL